MLVIATTGRCGSSVLSKICKRSGLNVRGQWIDTLDGGVEDKDALKANQRIRRGKPYKHILNRLRSVDIVKNIQIVYNPDLLEVWNDFFEDMYVLFLTRNPEDIITSMRRHSPTFDPILERNDIGETIEEFRRKLKALNISYDEFRFPQFLYKPECVQDALSRRGLTPQNMITVWNNTINYDKVHV